MNQAMTETRTKIRNIFDFLLGFLASLVVGNIGIVVIAPFDTPERLWISYFTWFWRFALAGLAVLLFTKKRIWISLGLIAAILLQLV